jgi:glycine reductase
MNEKLRVVHFLNQFFGGIGGEEHANSPVQVEEGPVGPGQALQQAIGGDGEVVATVISGDNYFNEEQAKAAVATREALGKWKPDVVVAGPALNAGRYGLSCGEICAIASDMGIPSVTGMYPENPGVLEYRRQAYIVPTGDTPTDMPKHIETMARLALKMGRGEEPGPADDEGYLPRGLRKAGFREKTGAVRAIDMLSARLQGSPFTTEIPVDIPDRVKPGAPIPDLTRTKIALVTAGALVPRGNPDKMVRGGAKEYFGYSIAGLDTMTGDKWESIHRGFFTDVVNENPNYILPLNLVRELERTGEIGGIHDTFFSTSGVGTAVAYSKQMGQQIAQELKEAGVRAAIMVAT